MAKKEMKELKLYEVDAKIEALLALEDGFEDADIDFPEECRKELEQLEGTREFKIFNIARFYKNLFYTASTIKLEEERLAKRRKSYERKANNLHEYLGIILKKDETLEDGAIKITWKAFQEKLMRSVIVQETNLETGELEDKERLIPIEEVPLKEIPEEYIKTEESLKLAELKKAVKQGLVLQALELKFVRPEEKDLVIK